MVPRIADAEKALGEQHLLVFIIGNGELDLSAGGNIKCIAVEAVRLGHPGQGDKALGSGHQIGPAALEGDAAALCAQLVYGEAVAGGDLQSKCLAPPRQQQEQNRRQGHSNGQNGEKGGIHRSADLFDSFSFFHICTHLLLRYFPRLQDAASWICFTVTKPFSCAQVTGLAVSAQGLSAPVCGSCTRRKVRRV